MSVLNNNLAEFDLVVHANIKQSPGFLLILWMPEELH